MKFARIFFQIALIIGLLEIVDGVLLIVDKGNVNWFNVMVSVFELYWIPVCGLAVVIFRKHKISMISPVSYLLYQTIGWTAASLLSNQENETTILPLWIGIVGAAFGLYYLVVNEWMKDKKQFEGGA